MRMRCNEQRQDYVCHGDPAHWAVAAVELRADYSLLLTFEDGAQRVYNALPLLEKAIYAPLKSLPFFLTAKAEGGTVIWNDEIDIAPEHLYECSEASQ